MTIICGVCRETATGETDTLSPVPPTAVRTASRMAVPALSVWLNASWLTVPSSLRNQSIRPSVPVAIWRSRSVSSAIWAGSSWLCRWSVTARSGVTQNWTFWA